MAASDATVMAKFTIFYANKLYGEQDDNLISSATPDGAYIRSHTGQWYRYWNIECEPIAQSELPPEMQAIALLYFN